MKIVHNYSNNLNKLSIEMNRTKLLSPFIYEKLPWEKYQPLNKIKCIFLYSVLIGAMK